MPKKSEKKTNDEIVISLDQFAIPGAIILVGLMISLTIFFSGKNKDNSVDDSSTDNVAGEETDDAGTDSEFTSASVEIGDSPQLGDSNAKVAIVEFSDYRCSYCLRHAEETFPSIMSDYVDTGKVLYVFHDFPIFGDDISNAAKCVYNIAGADVYKEFHLGAFNSENDDAIYALAKNLGVNESQFDSCYSSSQYQDEIDAEYQAGQDIGIQGTPGFVVGTIEDGVVNGVLVPGAYPYETFQDIVDGLLSE
jgi:protein-disulfide isomerase